VSVVSAKRERMIDLILAKHRLKMPTEIEHTAQACDIALLARGEQKWRVDNRA
jgi:hypothetical protein